ncbi:insulinase family protein [Ruminiclostridium herbifermentans]|uniref:Insulinase family protein n=1 Tax=Ruminiclostridium herbifermentans TaxID=2488810 RepID=A0A4U7JJI0_9FIRM|nr:insulinase family protein [Ruminiclostridium herbifermentans]QNU66186.1 insulinase family protein [Ruminiclostridium herbifermentans]
MNRIISVLASLVCICIWFTGCNTSQSSVYEEFSYKNIDIIQIKNDLSRNIVMSFYYKCGYDQEIYPEEANWYITNIMLGSDTKKYSAKEIKTIMQENGISITSGYNQNYGSITSKFLLKDYDLASDLLKELVFECSITDNAFKECQNNYLTQASKTLTSEKVLERIKNIYFGNEEQKSSNIDIKESSSQLELSLDSLKKYYEQNIKRGKLSLVVAGNIPKSRILKTLKGISLSQNKENEYISEPPISQESKKVYFIAEGEKSIITLSKYEAVNSRDIIDLYFIRGLLEKRLNDNIRRKMGEAYIVNVSVEIGKPSTLIIRIVSNEPEVVGRTLKDELDRFEAKDISQQELKIAYEKFITEFYLSLEKKERLATFLGSTHILGLNFKELFSNPDEKVSIDPNNLNDIICELKSNMCYFGVGNYSEVEKSRFEGVFEEK